MSDVQAVCESAREFLEGFLLENLCFTPDEDLENEDAEGSELMVCLCYKVVPYKGKVHVGFQYGSAVDLDQHAPRKAAETCVEALKEALPEVEAYGVAFEVRAQEMGCLVAFPGNENEREGSRPMAGIRMVCEEAEDFLIKFLDERDSLTPYQDIANEDAEGTELMVCQVMSVAPYKGKVHIEFEYGEAVDLSKHDPNKAAEVCVEALKVAVPEVEAFGVAFDMQAQEAL